VPNQETACAEKLRLSEAIAKAIKAIYTANSPEEKIAALAAERDAVRALNAHQEQHGC
jgi:hypothetical protein